MRKIVLIISFIPLINHAWSQTGSGQLTVEKIMQDTTWIGTSPSNLQWSNDGTFLYFNWNPEESLADSLYFITTQNMQPVKASAGQYQLLKNTGNYIYNASRTRYLYTQYGDIFFSDLKTKRNIRITKTVEAEFNPQFSFNETTVVYNRYQNLYSWKISTGETEQLTNFKKADVISATALVPGRRTTADTSARAIRNKGNQQEEWLKNDQLQNFEVLQKRKKMHDSADAFNKRLPQANEPKLIQLDDRNMQDLTISPDGRFITYRLFRPASAKTTVVPCYVTETGFTTDLNSRSKVGDMQGSSESFIYDRQKDSVWSIQIDSIPGIRDLPDYIKDYPKQQEESKRNPARRPVSFYALSWSPSVKYAVYDIRSQDNKDRWLMLMDTASGKLSLLDRQRDEAWVGGPGIGRGRNGWIDDNHFWFHSESSGYSHLYIKNILSGEKKALTAGRYEIQQAQLSLDKKYFYIHTNEVHPGELQFYRLAIADGKKDRITSMTGSNQVTISPDEKWLAILYSYSNKPWELFLQENPFAGKTYKPSAAIQVTNKAQSDEFRKYPWRDPELVTFKARDGADVYARLFKPDNPQAHKPAVLFVHGVGYLQNAHKWWSSYFREYMFNNLLAENGYYVIDVDYRGSAGYGRDWRTGIYRHMGGKDLTDNIDAVEYLVKNFGVDPKRIGLYGGSYGGFITLMGMFNAPDVFAAGAALRPVTDWANYNHGYTSNILNEPYNDSLAYHVSSPYYYANGLKGHLLICHGMEDVNVHFQDAVKLVQRLIELGKNNWEIAPYPMEDHAFTEPSSWTDEYKRIFKLFETVLKK